MKRRNLLTVITALSLISVTGEAKIKLPALFTDNMVLQQQSTAPIWGEAKPGKKVKITTSWDKKEYSVTAGNDGKWHAGLQTPVYGGPYHIEISDGSKTKLNNVMIGEVWICSGQSNMEMPLAGWGKINDYKKEIEKAEFPDIRLFHVKKTTAMKPQDDVVTESGGWVECSPATIPEFSSVAYFFGSNIHISQDVPVGLISTSWGGTVAEAWTSGEMLSEMPDFTDPVMKIEEIAAVNQNFREKYHADLAKWHKLITDSDPGLENGKGLYCKVNFDDSEWGEMNVPGIWESQGLYDYDGIVWFRKEVDIPEEWDSKRLTLDLGMIDDNDITYFNGTEIGRTEGWNKSRSYSVPENLVKKGRSVISVRVHDTSGDGGLYDKDIRQVLKLSDDNVMAIDGRWKYCASLSAKDLPAAPRNYDSPNHPTLLYNAMIAPLVPYKIKGAIWYQGESNASRAYQYRELFPLMIKDWREKWNDNFPFYFVQLANFRQSPEYPGNSDWAELREAQLMTLSLENTGMAVTIDIGDADDIHPKNKQEVGRRLALAARANTYGENIAFSGPLYDSYKIEGNKVRISFKHAEGLKTSDNKELSGFAVAGPDRKFRWAKAEISGNEVIVYCEDIKDPIAVRYAWATNPVCNLINSDELPASPFRTDDWQGLTSDKN